MKRLINCILAVSCLFAFQAALACDYPERTDIPNGGTASKEEMVDGQKGVKKFVSEMETYLDCLVEEERAARSQIENLEPEDEQMREDMLTKKYNAAVEEMEKVAAQFNEQVQAYKARGE